MKLNHAVENSQKISKFIEPNELSSLTALAVSKNNVPVPYEYWEKALSSLQKVESKQDKYGASQLTENLIFVQEHEVVWEDARQWNLKKDKDRVLQARSRLSKPKTWTFFAN